MRVPDSPSEAELVNVYRALALKMDRIRAAWNDQDFHAIGMHLGEISGLASEGIDAVSRIMNS